MKRALLLLWMIGCGGMSPADFNRRGEEYSRQWEKTEDNTDFVLALKAFREAVNLEPGNPVYHYNLGTLLAAARCYEQAQKELENATTLAPHYKDALQNLDYVNDALANKESQCQEFLPSVSLLETP